MPAVTPPDMGYIGGVEIGSLGAIRATSCGLAQKQTIDHPDVIDGSLDWTVYQLRGIEIEGDVAFPVLGGSFLTGLFEILKRNKDTGNFLNPTGVAVKVLYGRSSNKGRTFNGCLCNSLSINASAGELANATINFWGTGMTESSSVARADSIIRALAWADISIANDNINSCTIKEFSISVANQLSRNYTFCNADGYYPNSITAGKRQCSGSFTVQGYSQTEVKAMNNSTSDSPNGGTIAFTFGKNDGASVLTFNNITYEYQTIEAQTGLITSTVNWYAHGTNANPACPELTN